MYSQAEIIFLGGPVAQGQQNRGEWIRPYSGEVDWSKKMRRASRGWLVKLIRSHSNTDINGSRQIAELNDNL
jgi:hypothetical protein